MNLNGLIYFLHMVFHPLRLGIVSVLDKNEFASVKEICKILNVINLESLITLKI